MEGRRKGRRKKGRMRQKEGRTWREEEMKKGRQCSKAGRQEGTEGRKWRDEEMKEGKKEGRGVHVVEDLEPVPFLPFIHSSFHSFFPFFLLGLRRNWPSLPSSLDTPPSFLP